MTQTPPFPEPAEPQAAPSPGGPAEIGPPPSFGGQMAQLVIIPAVIVLICIGLAVLFGKLAGGDQDIDAYVLKLKQSGGGGKLIFDIQDPRYKDRWLAAYNVAMLIPSIKSPAEKQKVSNELLEVLKSNVQADEEQLQAYLFAAVGQLGQPGGLDALIAGLDVKGPQARRGAIRGILLWPDIEAARQAVPGLRKCLTDADPAVAAEAAVAMSKLAQAGDQATIDALHRAMDNTETVGREVVWNAAAALTKLGDPRGRNLVVNVLLDRKKLAQMPAGDSGDEAQMKMSPETQDRVILTTLASVEAVTDAELLHKIKEIADNDPNRVIRVAAQKLLLEHEARSK